jgi:hypothetical protein
MMDVDRAWQGIFGPLGPNLNPENMFPFASPQGDTTQIDTAANGFTSNVTFNNTATAWIDGVGASMNVSNESVEFFGGTSANIVGGNDTVYLNKGNDYVGLCTPGNPLDTVYAAAGATVGTVNNTSFNIVGSNNTINMGPSSYVGLCRGGSYAVNTGGNCTIGTVPNIGFNEIGSNITDILGSGSYVGILAGSTGVGVYGNGISFGEQTGSYMNLIGSNDINWKQ